MIRQRRRTCDGIASLAAAAPQQQSPATMPRRGGGLSKRIFALSPRLIGFVALAMVMRPARGEEEEKVTEASMGVSVMLMGAIWMMMSLFYLVNSEDPEFKMYSWQVISSTISIFSAVMLFSGVHGVLEYYFLEDASDAWKICVGFTHMFLWWCCLQVTLALITGAVQLPSLKKEMDFERHPEHVRNMEEEVRRHALKKLKEEDPDEEYEEVGGMPHPDLILEIAAAHEEADLRGNKVQATDYVELASECLRTRKLELEKAWGATKRSLKCWAVLLGHITGFAAISAFGEVQQQYGKDNVIFCWLMGFIAYGVLFLLQIGMDHIRRKVAEGDDGEEDEMEKLWDEATEETEDDVVGLACSFMFAQALRYSITGDLPNVEGEEPEGVKHSDAQAFTLFIIGLVLIILDLVRLLKFKQRIPRVTDQFRNIVMMTFSWCLYFTTDWLCKANIEADAMLTQVWIAISVTFTALILIFLLDKFADMECTNAEVDKMLRESVSSLAILIGFGWEKTFDMGVIEITTYLTFRPICWSQLVMGLIIAAWVIPAWRIYILPIIVEYEEIEEAKKELEEEAEEEEGKEDAEIGKKGLEAPLLDAEKEAEKERKAMKGKMKALNSCSAEEMKAKMRGLMLELNEANKENASHRIKLKELEVVKMEKAKLEATIDQFSSEVTQLQKLADKLTNS